MNISQVARALTKLAVLPIKGNLGYATGALTSTPIDLEGYFGTLRFEFNAISLAGGSSPTLDGAFYTGPTTSALSTLVTGGAITQVGNTASAQTMYLDTRTIDRYLAFAVTVGGTGTFAFAIEGFGLKNPLA